MKKLFKKLITGFVLRNFPFIITTQVNHFTTIQIKKGKLREFRTYDSNNNRMVNVMH